MKRVSISSTLLLAAVAGVGFFLFGRKILFFGTTRSSSSWRFDEDVPSSTNSTIAQQLNSQITPTAQSAQTMTDPMQDGPKQNEKMVKEEHALGPNDSAPVVHSHVAENTALCRQDLSGRTEYGDFEAGAVFAQHQQQQQQQGQNYYLRGSGCSHYSTSFDPCRYGPC